MDSSTTEEKSNIQGVVSKQEDPTASSGSASAPAVQGDNSGEEKPAPDKIIELIDAVTKAELNIPEVTIDFPKRQGKEHSLQFSLEKKREDKIQLTIGIDSRKDRRTFNLSFFQFNKKEKDKAQLQMRIKATCGKDEAQDVDSIAWVPEDNCFKLCKKLSDNVQPNYSDVLMYWFGDDQDLRPNIKFVEQSAVDAITNEQQRFLTFLSENWPSYDNGTWGRVQYKDTVDDEDDHSSDEEENPVEKNLHLIGICGGVIGFLRKFIINGIFFSEGSTNGIWAFGKGILGKDKKDKVDIFIKKPDVDLNPVKFKIFLEGRGLFFDFNTLDMVCTALNSGDNVILTGGPGCGKTSLAKGLLEFSDYRGITATAASTWTTDELIGRYVPETRKDSGSVLKFQRGFFLDAIKDKKWLLIDEMNRAPIDQCFGELFSILSGHSVELPFEDRIAPDEPPRRLRIAAPNSSEGGSSNETSITLTVSPSFRLLCTMNDVDKDKLEQLSFALQRRFHIIRLDSPGLGTVEKKIKSTIKKKMEDYSNAGLKLFCTSKAADKKISQFLDDALTQLFASPEGLLAKGVVGMAQLIDVTKFAIRRLFLIGESKNAKPKSDDLKSYILSGVALGIVTKVYPQLPNFMVDFELQKVLKGIVDLFRKVFADIPMMSFYEENSSVHGTICNYLKNEFVIQFKRLLPDGVAGAFWSETPDGTVEKSE